MCDLKAEFRSYRYWKKRLEEVKEMIDVIWYMMSGVSGLDPSKEGGSTNPALKNEYKMELSSKIEALETEKKRLELNIKRIDNMLTVIDNREIVEEVLIKGNTYSNVAMKFNYAPSAIFKMVNRSLNQLRKEEKYSLK